MSGLQTSFWNNAYNNVYALTQERKFIRGILMGTALAALLVGLYFAYRFYIVYRERTAQQTYSTLAEQFETTQSSSPDVWADIAMQFEHGYRQNSSSDLAPAFLARKADALVKQNKLDEAREEMHKVVKAVSASSPLYNAYQTKYALMQLDAADEATVTQGLEALKGLAENNKNEQRDQALFYLGRYYWVKDDVERARSAWNTLLQEFNTQDQYVSPWSVQAQEYLQQIG